MAKISQLPVLAAPNGDELVPVVKDGETMHARLAQLSQGLIIPLGDASVITNTEAGTEYEVAIPIGFEPLAEGAFVDFVIPETSKGPVTLHVGTMSPRELFMVRAQRLVAGWTARVRKNDGGGKWDLDRQVPQGLDLLNTTDVAESAAAGLARVVGVPLAVPIAGNPNEFFVDFDRWENDATFEALIIETNTVANPIINLASGQRRAVRDAPAGALQAGTVAKFVVSFGVDDVILRGSRTLQKLADLGRPQVDLWSVVNDAIANPWGDVTQAADGTPILSPRRLRLVGRASSVGTDPGNMRARPGAADPSQGRQGASPPGQAPVAVLGQMIADAFAPAFAVKVDNWAHGGDVAQQGELQWSEAMADDPSGVDILMDCFGMNDMRESSYNAGQQSPLYFGNPIYYEGELIRRFNDGVKMIVLCTTPHLHPGRRFSDFGGNTMRWPYQKDAPVAPAQLVPPVPIDTRDWTGSGKDEPGDVRGDHVNQLIRNVARRLNSNPLYAGRVVLLDVEWAWFRFGVEVHGYDALYNPGELVHPNLLGHQVSYWRCIREFVAAMRRGRGDQWCFRGEAG